MPMPANYSEEVKSVKKAIKNRLAWLDTKWVATNCPSPLSINAVSTGNGMQLYPNPTNGLLHIELPVTTNHQVTYTLSTIQGLVVKCEAINQFSFNLDLSSLSSGVYLLKVQTATGIISRKVVKEN